MFDKDIVIEAVKAFVVVYAFFYLMGRLIMVLA
jgi:hypothetical protein